MDETILMGFPAEDAPSPLKPCTRNHLGSIRMGGSSGDFMKRSFSLLGSERMKNEKGTANPTCRPFLARHLAGSAPALDIHLCDQGDGANLLVGCVQARPPAATSRLLPSVICHLLLVYFIFCVLRGTDRIVRGFRRPVGSSTTNTVYLPVLLPTDDARSLCSVDSIKQSIYTTSTFLPSLYILLFFLFLLSFLILLTYLSSSFIRLSSLVDLPNHISVDPTLPPSLLPPCLLQVRTSHHKKKKRQQQQQHPQQPLAEKVKAAPNRRRSQRAGGSGSATLSGRLQQGSGPRWQAVEFVPKLLPKQSNPTRTATILRCRLQSQVLLPSLLLGHHPRQSSFTSTTRPVPSPCPRKSVHNHMQSRPLKG